MRRVFVYGTLKSDGIRADIMELNGATLVGTGVIRGYTLYSVGDRFPAALPKAAGERTGHFYVEGELWELPEDVATRERLLRVLDGIENVPYMYRREAVLVLHTDGDTIRGTATGADTYLWNGPLYSDMREIGRRWDNVGVSKR